MPLEIEDIAHLLGGSSPVPVGRVINQARHHLSQKTSTILLSTETARHIMIKHGDHLRPADLTLIPLVIAQGLWVADRERWCRISYLDQTSGVRYLVALKATISRQEVFVGTFHRAQKGQTKALLKRGEILRRHL